MSEENKVPFDEAADDDDAVEGHAAKVAGRFDEQSPTGDVGLRTKLP
jgi:hypothetical protein